MNINNEICVSCTKNIANTEILLTKINVLEKALEIQNNYVVELKKNNDATIKLLLEVGKEVSSFIDGLPMTIGWVNLNGLRSKLNQMQSLIESKSND